MTASAANVRASPAVIRRWSATFSLVLTFALSACGEPGKPSIAAVPLAIEGQCELLRGSQAEPAPLARDSRPRPGDSIRTAYQAHASLELLGNTLVTVTPDTEVRLVTLALTKDGDETGAAIRQREVGLALRRGSLLVSQEEEPGMAATLRLVVDTARGVARTNFDAVFQIEADEQHTRIVCASGSLLFQAAGDPVAYTLKAGFVGEWSESISDVKPSETDRAAQEQLSELLAVTPKLRAQRDARRNDFPATAAR